MTPQSADRWRGRSGRAFDTPLVGGRYGRRGEETDRWGGERKPSAVPASPLGRQVGRRPTGGGTDTGAEPRGDELLRTETNHMPSHPQGEAWVTDFRVTGTMRIG